MEIIALMNALLCVIISQVIGECFGIKLLLLPDVVPCIVKKL